MWLKTIYNLYQVEMKNESGLPGMQRQRKSEKNDPRRTRRRRG
jgi:hypothetical protein